MGRVNRESKVKVGRGICMFPTKAWDDDQWFKVLHASLYRSVPAMPPQPWARYCAKCGEFIVES